MIGYLGVLVALKVLVGFAGGYGEADLDRFRANTGIELPSWYAEVPPLLTWARGDGEVFLALAADPLIEDEASNIRSPGYRFTKSGYAWAMGLVAFGQTALLPIAALVVNVGSAAIYGAWVVRRAERDGRLTLLLANPAMLIGFVSDSSEPLALAALVTALSATRGVGLVGALVGAVRPDYATVLPAGRRPGAAVLGAVAAFVSLRVAARLLRFDGLDGFARLGLPFRGYVAGLGGELDDLLLIACIPLLVVLGVVAWWIRPRRLQFAWVATIGLMIVLAAEVTQDAVNLLRAWGSVPILVALWLGVRASSEAERQGEQNPEGSEAP